MNTHGKLNRWLLFTICLCALVLALFYFSTYSQTSNANREVITSIENTSITQSQNEGKISTKYSEDKTSEPHNENNEIYTKQDVSITSEWMRRIGKFTHQERADYENYSKDTLIPLADAGDIKAMDALFTRYLAEGNTEKAGFYGEKQVIYGSISAIADMVILTQPNQQTPENQRDEKFIYTLALTKLISIRGDDNLADIIRKNSIRNYNNEFNTSITEITLADQQKVDLVAKDIFDNIKQKRLALGLGDFDTIPEAVKKFQQLISSH